MTRSGTLVKVTVTQIFKINEAGQGQIYFFWWNKIDSFYQKVNFFAFAINWLTGHVKYKANILKSQRFVMSLNRLTI